MSDMGIYHQLSLSPSADRIPVRRELARLVEEGYFFRGEAYFVGRFKQEREKGDEQFQIFGKVWIVSVEYLQLNLLSVKSVSPVARIKSTLPD
jgi:hypothetical protein